MAAAVKIAAISVVVRAKDEADSIGRLLDLLAAQELAGRALELIVVDSGSRDGTVAIAHARGATVTEIAAADFTFGGALNTGAAVAGGELIVALSAHAFPRDAGWLARMADVFDDPCVACACGDAYAPGGGSLHGRVTQDAALLARHPYWGYSNVAGAFRAELWRALPFRTDMPGTEDKAWAHHWIERGHTCVVGADLAVEHDHTRDPLRAQFERSRREWIGFASYLDLAPYRACDLAREWWSEHASYGSRWRARIAPQRAARLLGAYAGRRHGS